MRRLLLTALLGAALLLGPTSAGALELPAPAGLAPPVAAGSGPSPEVVDALLERGLLVPEQGDDGPYLCLRSALLLPDGPICIRYVPWAS